MIAFQASDNDGSLASMTAPGGWTQVTQVGGSSSGYSKIWRKVATSGDVAASSFQFQDYTGSNTVVGIMAIQVGTYDPSFFASSPATADGGGTFTASHIAPTQPNGVVNGLLITFHCADTGGTQRSYTGTPSGMTKRIEDAVSYSLLGVFTQLLVASGATGTRTATSSGAPRWNAHSLVVLPSAVVVHAATASLVATPTLFTPRPSEATSAALTAVPSLTGGTPVPSTPAIANLTTTPVLSQITLLDTVSATLETTPTLTTTSKKIVFAQAHLLATPTWQFRPRIIRPPVLRTIYARPPLTHPFRVIAQHILTGEIVDWDLPVDEDFEYVRQLSGPTIMKGAFKPEIISVQELGLDGYAYWFHVEIDNEIRASAIFLPPQYEETSLNFTAEGISSAPHNVFYEGELVGLELDPLDIVRDIWNHVQSQPRSNYNVIVSNHTSNVRLGVPAYTETTPPVPPETEPTVREVEDEPYELVWWDAVNCGAEIDSLASETPFDYVERSQWNSDKNNVEYYVDLGFPRAGVARANLRFDEDNILEVVPVQEGEESYASAVIVIGAGEGRDTIRGYASVDFADRMRRTFVVTDKTVTTTDRANAMATTELGIRRGRLFEISEIVIRANHQNARLGEYDIGDDIEVSVDIPWLIDTYTAWYRITSISFAPSKDRVRLGLERSDSFRYPVV